MKLILKIAALFAANAAALYMSAKYVQGVVVPSDARYFAIVALALTLINLLIRPIVKLALTPVIILTLGIGTLAVNALMLYLLDFAFAAVTILGLKALFLSTIVVTAFNVVARRLIKFL